MSHTCRKETPNLFATPASHRPRPADAPSHRGPSSSHAVLGLLQLGHRLEVDGDVLVTVEEVCDLADWVTALHEPTVLVWRDIDVGDRHLQMSARHDSPPVRGVITVWWRTAIVHTFWSALLDGGDLAVGTERELTRADVQAALTSTRMSVSREA